MQPLIARIFTSSMGRLYVVALLSLFAACGRQEVIEMAKADFKSSYPRAQIKKVHLGEGDAEHAYVHVQYFETPVTASPSTSALMEVEMGYRKIGNKWTLFHEGASQPLKLAR